MASPKSISELDFADMKVLRAECRAHSMNRKRRAFQNVCKTRSRSRGEPIDHQQNEKQHDKNVYRFVRVQTQTGVAHGWVRTGADTPVINLVPARKPKNKGKKGKRPKVASITNFISEDKAVEEAPRPPPSEPSGDVYQEEGLAAGDRVGDPVLQAAGLASRPLGAAAAAALPEAPRSAAPAHPVAALAEVGKSPEVAAEPKPESAQRPSPGTGGPGDGPTPGEVSVPALEDTRHAPAGPAHPVPEAAQVGKPPGAFQRKREPEAACGPSPGIGAPGIGPKPVEAAILTPRTAAALTPRTAAALTPRATEALTPRTAEARAARELALLFEVLGSKTTSLQLYCRAMDKLRCVLHSGSRVGDLITKDRVYTLVSSMSTMAGGSESEVAQRAGCEALLQVLSANVDLRTAIVDAGGVREALRAMRFHRGSSDLQECGLRLLRELAANHTPGQGEIVACSGLKTVLEAMSLHLHVPSIQVAGCGVLRNMSSGSAHHQTAIASLGGTDIIIDAMNHHASHAEVQWAGCWALFCLSWKNRALQSELASSGAAMVVLRAMEAHIRSAKVQEAGCWALIMLATDNSFAALSLAVDAVSAAMKAHADKDVQVAGSNALRRLISYDRDKTPAAVRYSDSRPRVRPTCLAKKRCALAPQRLPAIIE